MIFLLIINVFLLSSSFAVTEECKNFLSENPNKNSSIYIVGELHEQDLQKHFIAEACKGSIHLGIEAPHGGFKTKVLGKYRYDCIYEENVFGFEDDATYSLLLLFREYIMLNNFRLKDQESFRKAEMEVLTLLWLSDLMTELWKEERDNVYAKLLTEEGKFLFEKLFHNFMELKQNKRFKRKMAANGSFIKSWNSLVKSEKLINTANLDELLDKGRGFMDVTKALALHLYERKNDYNLPCYVSYMKDLDDESLGLFCYLELMGLRDRSIYKNIMDYYCDLAASSSPRFSREPMVITIGSGHLPDIVGRLRSNLGPNINVKTYAYKSSIDYAIDAKEYVRVSAKNMNSGLFNQDFYEIMEKSIDFFNGPELTVIDEGASPLSILGRL